MPSRPKEKKICDKNHYEKNSHNYNTQSSAFDMLGKLAVRSIIKITTFAKQKIKFSTSTFINFRASRHDIQNFKNREGWKSKNYNVQRNFYKKLLSSTEKSRKIHENRYSWKIIVHLFSKKNSKSEMTNETEKGGNVLHFQQSIFKYRFQFGKTKFR